MNYSGLEILNSNMNFNTSAPGWYLLLSNEINEDCILTGFEFYAVGVGFLKISVNT